MVKVLGHHDKLVEGWGDEAKDSRTINPHIERGETNLLGKRLPDDGRELQLAEWQPNKTAHSSDAEPR